MKTKICGNNKCQKEKPVECFSKASRTSDGYHWECKECKNERGKQYYAENKKEINRKHREKYRENPEPILARQREYYTNNKDKKQEYATNNKERIKENRRKNDNRRRQNDISYKLHKSISRRISDALFKQGANKNNHSIFEHLNYSPAILIWHLEQNFEWWMTWDNYGSYNPKTWNDNDPSTWAWNIDHIIPRSDLPYDSMDHLNFRACWQLPNLRPYSAKLNLLEGTSRKRHVLNRKINYKHFSDEIWYNYEYLLNSLSNWTGPEAEKAKLWLKKFDKSSE